MYSLLQDLVLRVNTLEEENRRYKQLLTRKVNIIDWLNNNTPPPMLFSRWLFDVVFPFVKDNLNMVFQNDLLKGIMATLDSALASMDTDQIPLRAFSGRNTAFYIFDNPNQGADDNPARSVDHDATGCCYDDPTRGVDDDANQGSDDH
jgi:hypothetical protein